VTDQLGTGRRAVWCVDLWSAVGDSDVDRSADRWKEFI